MKKMNKAIALVLAGTMAASTLAGCGGNKGADSNTADNTTNNTADTTAENTGDEGDSSEAAPSDYDAVSADIYQKALGDFITIYEDAKASDTVAERFAKMAQAEAKLMESAVMLPSSTRGGMYALRRWAPNSNSTTLWGNDNMRFHNRLVTEELVKADDCAEMKAKWTELRGTGKYEDWAKDFLKEKGYTIKDTLNIPYTADVSTWDVLNTSQSVDSDAIVNTFDGLMEYDCENELQPALAESYEVSEDGLTYTFHLRKGVEWVDSQGRKVADLTADDFVAGMQHMLDCQAGLEYLVNGIIVNAGGYIDGSVTDFNEVGVKAEDDYTLVYTLEAPCTYFTTMLCYNIFAPMSRSYYTSQGGKFGSEFDSSASDYTYGKDTTSIAYCGPYVVTNCTEKNTIVFDENESYWNKDNINIKTITWLYNDGTDVSKTYNDVKNGIIDGANLTTATMTIAKKDGLFDDYAAITDTESVTFSSFYNLNRAQFANANDSTVAVSTQTPEDAARTKAAMNNVHFRRAISFATDRGAYNAQSTGEELKLLSLRNSYTPGNFVSLDEEVTLDMNGESKTYPAGTFYGEIMQDQIDADGVKIKVWDAENNTSDGFDGWYNPENAVEELDKAIEELSAQGVTIDADNPIYLDLPYPSTAEVYANKANAYKQSIEESLGKKVIVNLLDCVDTDKWQYAGYFTSYGYEQNYDIYDLSGWGPDYGDPQSYLDTFLPDYEGYVVKSLCIY